MPLCLLGSATISLFLGFADIIRVPFTMLAILLAINGCVQGAGWPASAKMIAHWFHPKERGQAMGIWNLSHNAGCGLLGPVSILAIALFADWQSKFYLPAIIAFCIAIACFFLLKDKPSMAKLPPPFPEQQTEAEINQKRTSFLNSLKLFFQHCLNIPALWILALANACVYFIRYGIIDWAPLFLTEERGLSFEASSWAFFAFEYAAIPGTLLCGYLSDHHFNGKRAPVNVLFMSLVAIALIFYWQCPASMTCYSIFPLVVLGFVIYGPLMLIHVHIIDVVPLPFAATAAGFCGLFGYLIGTTSANLLLGRIIDHYDWDVCFQLLTGASLLTIGLLILLWLWENFHPNPNLNFLCGKAQPATVPVRNKNQQDGP